MKSEIDAVSFVREIRDAQYEQLKHRSWEERIAYYKAKAQALHKLLKEKRENNGAEGAFHLG